MVLLPWFTYIKTNINIYGANVNDWSIWQHIASVSELAGRENDIKDASDDSLLTGLDHSSVYRIKKMSFPNVCNFVLKGTFLHGFWIGKIFYILSMLCLFYNPPLS